MRMLGFAVLAVGSAWLSGAQANPSQNVSSQGVSWEVKHRFRVVREHRHDEFIRHFNSFVEGRGAAHVIDPIQGTKPSNRSPFRPQLATYYSQTASQYNHSWFHRSSREIVVRSTLATDRTKQCEWRVDERRWSAPAPCSKPATLESSVGKHQLYLRIRAAGSTIAIERPPVEIEIKDMKFLALGDSFASGEGNPHVPFNQGTDGFLSNPRQLADWWDHRCHRSLLASSAQTAVMLAQKRRDTSVTYVSYACSGGTIDQGIIGTYAGVETAREARDRLAFFGAGSPAASDPDPMLPSQISMAKALLCKKQGEANCQDFVQPDIVSFTTGGNELRFGPKVVSCATGTCRFSEAEMREPFEKLKALYDKLAPELNGLKAKAVFLVTYPNMTRAADGRTYCGDSIFDADRTFVPSLSTFLSFGISRAEARSAERYVLNPLNSRISAWATEQGWVPVGGFSRKHGFCVRSPGSWFYTVSESMKRQGQVGSLNAAGDAFNGLFPSGAMHPNVFGHAEMRGRLLAEIEKKLPR